MTSRRACSQYTYVRMGLAVAFSLVLALAMSNPAGAQTTWYVDDDNCPGPGSGTVGDPFCLLQTAVTSASGGDTITVAEGTYNEHDITIDKSLTIQGAGAVSTIVDAGHVGRGFHIDGSVASVTVAISGLTVQNGSAGLLGGANVYVDGSPASATVTIADSIIRNGSTIGDGGGIRNYHGSILMTNCTITGNVAANGGALSNLGNATLTCCTISGNEGTVVAGGVVNSALDTVTMDRCTIAGNWAPEGGGFYNNGDLTLTNSTVSGNASTLTAGGGGYNAGTLTATCTTITDNEARVGALLIGTGGGIADGNIFTMGCTIIYGNRAALGSQNISGFYTDIGGESIVDQPVGSAPDPELGSLQDNGGCTQTHALGDGSAAIDMCTSCPCGDTDQRGVSRPEGEYCDTGSYEAEDPTVVVLDSFTARPYVQVRDWALLGVLGVGVLAAAEFLARRSS